MLITVSQCFLFWIDSVSPMQDTIGGLYAARSAGVGTVVITPSLFTQEDKFDRASLVIQPGLKHGTTLSRIASKVASAVNRKPNPW